MPATDNRVCHIHDLHVVRRAWLVHGNRGYPIIALVIRGLCPNIRIADEHRYEQLPATAPASCAHTNRPLPLRRLSRCRGLRCNSCLQSPSASGSHATAPSPPAAGRAVPSLPHYPDCRTAPWRTPRQSRRMLLRALPKTLAGLGGGRRNETPPRCTCCALRTSALRSEEHTSELQSL